MMITKLQFRTHRFVQKTPKLKSAKLALGSHATDFSKMPEIEHHADLGEDWLPSELIDRQALNF